jgi:hypothetical protein
MAVRIPDLWTLCGPEVEASNVTSTLAILSWDFDVDLWW